MEERHQCISFKWKWCIWNRYSYATRRQMCGALHELIGFFKSQQITNNNKHLLFVVQCNNFNICLVTVDACNITTTKGAQLKEHIFWFKRSFFIPLLLVFRIFPKEHFFPLHFQSVSQCSAHISNGALKFCAFTSVWRRGDYQTADLLKFLLQHVCSFCELMKMVLFSGAWANRCLI